MDKILGRVLVKGVPAELIGDLMELRGPEMRSLGDGKGGKVLVGARRQDPVEPGLLVRVAGSGEGCAGELLGVESERGLLGGIAVSWERAFAALESSRIGECDYLLQLRFPCSCRSHSSDCQSLFVIAGEFVTPCTCTSRAS